jgi:hypothetical protein
VSFLSSLLTASFIRTTHTVERPEFKLKYYGLSITEKLLFNKRNKMLHLRKKKLSTPETVPLYTLTPSQYKHDSFGT